MPSKPQLPLICQCRHLQHRQGTDRDFDHPPTQSKCLCNQVDSNATTQEVNMVCCRSLKQNAFDTCCTVAFCWSSSFASPSHLVIISRWAEAENSPVHLPKNSGFSSSLSNVFPSVEPNRSSRLRR